MGCRGAPTILVAGWPFRLRSSLTVDATACRRKPTCQWCDWLINHFALRQGCASTERKSLPQDRLRL